MDGEFDIQYAQPPYTLAKHPSSIIVQRNEDIYGSNEFYPYESYKLTGVERLAGIDIAFITVYPYKYSPARKELSYYRQVSLRIRTVSDPVIRAQQLPMVSRSASVLDRLEELTVNPAMVESYPEMDKNAFSSSFVDPGDPVSYLIIAGADYLTTFADYAAWKEAHGVSAAVYTIEAVLGEYSSGVDDADNLRDFIIDCYQTWASSDTPLEYVLLAGDDEIIPVRGCWGRTGVYPDDFNMPCDLYYGCLDGDWNANGNAYFGEVDDDPDLLPEVHVGRFPGDNAQDFANMIYKTMQYVDNPWPALMVGELLYSEPLLWGGDLLDLICDDTAYMPESYQITKMYDRDGTFSTAAVTQHVNADQSALIYHCAHTHFYYLLGWSQTDVDNLQNTRYPFMSSGGCHTMAFDQATSGHAESVGEHALLAEHAMMAYLGSSRYGISVWVNFIQELMVAAFNPSIGSLGASLSYSRDQLVHYIDTTDEGHLWRWEYYNLIYAGDPQVHLISNCADSDLDTICDVDDNCPTKLNPFQEDTDGDMIGDSCDNCIDTYNPGQEDGDMDGIGNACDYVCGDADGSGTVDIDDVVSLIAYIFSGGPEPVPYASGDADCSGAVDIDDAVWLIAYIFSGGPQPCSCAEWVNVCGDLY
jgi:hypothetical protein